jgi:hypothetical protein
MTGHASNSAAGPNASNDRRCQARRSDGEPCQRWAIKGATVCPSHGGSIKRVRAAAARRLQREQLEGDLGVLLAELEIQAADRHPVDVLLAAVARCSAMAQVLGALVGGLTTTTGGPGALWGPNHLGDGAPHVLTTMYGQWLDRAARASKLAIEAGVEERRVRLAEQLSALVVDVLRGVLDDLDLSAEQRAAAAVAMPRRLQLIAGGLDEGARRDRPA